MSNWLSCSSCCSWCGSAAAAAFVRLGGSAICYGGMLMPVLWRDGCCCCWVRGGERTFRGTMRVGEDCLPCICTCWAAWLEVPGRPPAPWGVEEAPGLPGWFIGDCLDGHEIGSRSVSILCLFFICIGSLNGLVTCIFYFSSEGSSGEFEFDLNSYC